MTTKWKEPEMQSNVKLTLDRRRNQPKKREITIWKKRKKIREEMPQPSLAVNESAGSCYENEDVTSTFTRNINRVDWVESISPLLRLQFCFLRQVSLFYEQFTNLGLDHSLISSLTIGNQPKLTNISIINDDHGH